MAVLMNSSSSLFVGSSHVTVLFIGFANNVDCRNWLPGRSIQGVDNVWQQDFLLLGQNRFVYHAFMSIPAVHILDMLPSRRSFGLANYLLREAIKGIDASFEQYNSGQLLSSAQLDCTLTSLIALVIQDVS